MILNHFARQSIKGRTLFFLVIGEAENQRIAFSYAQSGDLSLALKMTEKKMYLVPFLPTSLMRKKIIVRI